MGERLKAVGFMSGTSMDGIDVALLETDGQDYVQPLAGANYPYSQSDRTILTAALDQAQQVSHQGGKAGVETNDGAIGDAEKLITDRHLAAFRAFLDENKVSREEVDLIGFHGQTILHRPEDRVTVQIGDGVRLAAQSGVNVIYDFRAQDVAAGGEGAPFVPIYHKALLRTSAVPLPAIVVNIGGVANVTFMDVDESLIAFDTGPGNALIDDWMQENDAGCFDQGGAAGLSGVVDKDVLGALMADPYLLLTPPKSLDRNHFSLAPVRGLSLEDGAATLAMFSSATLAKAVELMPQTPKTWILCGGGVKNGAIVQNLNNLCPGQVLPASDLGWNTDLVEAEAFAYLAVRSAQGLALTFPGTTGVPSPMTGGRHAWA